MRQIETGPRQVMEYDHKGQLIHVVTAYEIRTDSWPFHVYVGPRVDQLRKVGGIGESASRNEAFELGFVVGRLFIDDPTPD
ncbi:hypothetical protein [Burkholderia sp. Bp9099]|uniref:hypothetical protein n=1 Tax=Burkholderia sp. Bp9099 TaxID=2184568 RepID=UPI000F5FF67D|nr:hypothetical protein [Burkholderia sp. Bp9099]RQZ50897.1 hypothetical protein DIE17_03730 [Burkholderia sp. Bp9099]